jgi:hypothetical protein
MAVFGPMSDQEASPIFGPYLQGLTLLGKSDIHLSCEDQARDSFLTCLRNGCKHFGDWDGSNDTLVASLHRVFAEIIPEQDHRNQLFDIVPPPHRTTEAAFTNAVNAKRLADLYLVLVADRTMAKHKQRSTE